MSDKPATVRRVAFCRVEELERSGFVKRWVDELRDELAAIRTPEGPRVISAICPHFGGEFDCRAAGREVVCRWHAWRFAAEDGRCLSHPVKTSLRLYRFAVEDGTLFVEWP